MRIPALAEDIPVKSARNIDVAIGGYLVLAARDWGGSGHTIVLRVSALTA
jgi:hypothetical protein